MGDIKNLLNLAAVVSLYAFISICCTIVGMSFSFVLDVSLAIVIAIVFSAISFQGIIATLFKFSDNKRIFFGLLIVLVINLINIAGVYKATSGFVNL